MNTVFAIKQTVFKLEDCDTITEPDYYYLLKQVDLKVKALVKKLPQGGSLVNYQNDGNPITPPFKDGKFRIWIHITEFNSETKEVTAMNLYYKDPFKKPHQARNPPPQPQRPSWATQFHPRGETK